MAQRSNASASRFLVPALCFIVMTTSVMQTAVVPIVGAIGSQLEIGTTAVGWVITSNLLAAAIATPILGRVADLRGKRPVLIGVLIVTTIGSVLAATTDSLTWLIVGRVLQGVSYALFPIGIAVLRDELNQRALLGAVGLFSGTLAFGGGIGLVLTGLVVADGADYRGSFWLVAGLNVAALLLALLVPVRPVSGTGTVDWWGALLLAAGLVLVLLALAEGSNWGWVTPATIGSGLGGLAVLAAWFAFERRAKDPLVSTGMLMYRPVLIANLVAFLTGMAMYVNFLGMALFVQAPRAVAGYGFGATPLETAAVYILPGTVVGIVVALVSGRLIYRFDARRVLLVSCLIGAAGFGMFPFAHEHAWQVITVGIVVMIFVNSAYAALPSLLVEAVAQGQTGVANSVNAIARTVGSSVASAVVASLLAGMVIQGTALPQERAYSIAYILGAGTALLAALLALFASRPPGRNTVESIPPAIGSRQLR